VIIPLNGYWIDTQVVSARELKWQILREPIEPINCDALTFVSLLLILFPPLREVCSEYFPC
jgi:hypothetical protein